MRNRASAQLVFRRDPSCTTPSLGLGRQPPAVLSHLGTPQVSSRAGSTSGDANFPQCERGPEACSERIGTEGVIGPRCSSARHWYSTCIGASASHLVAFMHDAEPQRMAWVEGPRPGALETVACGEPHFFDAATPPMTWGRRPHLDVIERGITLRRLALAERREALWEHELGGSHKEWYRLYTVVKDRHRSYTHSHMSIKGAGDRGKT